jgi:hypothetical protein
MIYLNKDDVGKNVYRVTQDYVVELSYFVKAKNADEARDIVLDNGGLKDVDDFKNLIKEDSDQLELDFYDVGFDGQTGHMLGKVVVDTLDQDEVELDKYATEGTI